MSMRKKAMETLMISKIKTTAAYDDIPVAATVRDCFASALAKRGEYVCPGGLSQPARAAHAFAYGAKNYPEDFGPWTHICRAIFDLPKTPTSGQKEVLLLRSKSSTIRKHLMKMYGLQFITKPGSGGRATFSDEDCANHALRRENDRLLRAHKSFRATYDLINPANIKNDQLRRWVTEGAAHVVKSLVSAEAKLQLTPPPIDTAVAEDKKPPSES